MKRTIKLVFLTCLILLVSALMLTACKDKNTPETTTPENSAPVVTPPEGSTPEETTPVVTPPEETTPPPHMHTEVIDPAVAPTCTTSGLTEGKHCATCFEVLVERKSIPALGHAEITNAAVAPTCTNDGKTEGKYCATCNEVLVAQKTIPAIGHTEVIDNAVAATCTTAGKTEGKHCSVCNEVLVAQTTVNALGHTEVIDKAVAATCTTAGKTEGKHCSVCNKVLVAQTTVNALGHSHNSTVTPPTATENGYTTYTCVSCGDTYTEAIIPTDFTVTASNREKVGYKGITGENLVIPAVFENKGTWYRVVAIGDDAFSYCSLVNSVVIPESVTTIGNRAFFGCHAYDLTIPSSVTSIGNYAFYGCQMTSIAIPSGVTTIAPSAFGNCNLLTSITIPSSVTNIGEAAFRDCKALKNITFSENSQLTSIGEEAFMNCRKLTNITIPNSVTNIGKSAFWGCSALKSIVIPDGVTKIEENTFYECTNLSWVVIPDSVTAISSYAFYYCNCLGKAYYGSVGSVLILNGIGINNTDLTTASRYYYRETQPTDATYEYWHYVDGVPTVWHVHTEVIDKAVAPTCTTTGLTEGKHCAVCNEVLVAQTTVPALGHAKVIDKAVDPTCTTAGKTEGKHCSVCKEVLVAQTTVPALGHTEVIDKAVAPICTTTGLTEGKHCSVCNEVLVAQATVPALGHTEVIDKAVAATCTTAGKTEGKHCSVCNEILVAQEIVPALGHTDEVVAITPPTITENGQVEYICSVCEESYFETIVPTSFIITRSNLSKVGYTGEGGEHLVIPAVFQDNGTWYRVEGMGKQAFDDCDNLLSVTIPDSVTYISEMAFHGCSGLREIVLSNNTTYIEEYAFWYCTKLTSIVIPNSVTKIADNAFTSCEALANVTMSNNVEFIGEGAFWGCFKLANLTLPDTVKQIGPYAFFSCSSLTSLTFEGTKDQWNAISKNGWNADSPIIYVVCSDGIVCLSHTEVIDEAVAPTCTVTGLTEGKHCSVCGEVLVKQEIVPALGHTYNSIVTPPTVTTDGYTTHTCTVCGDILIDSHIPATGSIGLSYTVNEDGTTCTITGMGTCTDTEIYIPSTIDGYTVTAIGEKAFAENSTITSIRIPNTVTTIGKRAFYKCTEITEFTIPESVTDIGTQIFYGCNKLTTVYYNGQYGSSANPFLDTKSIETVVFGGTSIPSYVAYKSTYLKKIVISDSVTSIGSWAFDSCSALTSIEFAENSSLYLINVCAFYNCSNLTSITIPASVRRIYSNAFYGCSKLEAYITDIGAWMRISFGDNSAYPNYYGTLHILDKNGNEITELVIPDNVTEIKDFTFRNCTALTSITIPDSVMSIGTFYGCSSLTSITIPDSITKIGNWTFYGCSSLTGITIPDCITSIGSYAFSGCTSLTSITIPDSVTSIGYQAFYNCTSLTSITIPDSVTSIDDYAFSGCTSLTSITIPDSITSIGNYAFSGCTSLTSITIPDSVTSIGSYALSNCTALTSITIPDSITSIGEGAFRGYNSLTSITFSGTIEQWNAIDSEALWSEGAGGYNVHCIDGIIVKPCNYHSYERDLLTNPARFEKTWGVCTSCGYIDDNHEHKLDAGKCIYCDYKFYTTDVVSLFDADGDSTKGVLKFSAALPEKFQGAIRVDAFKDSTGNHAEYDAIRSDSGTMPYPHAYCYPGSDDEINYTITVDTTGIYELAVHIYLKNGQQRGATFIINRGTANEYSFSATFEWASDDEAVMIRNNDLLQGAYYTGLTVALQKGVNTITITTITSTPGVIKTPLFRDFYFIKVGETCAHEYRVVESEDATCTIDGYITYTCSLCGKTKTENVPTYGHTEVIDEAVAPTCTETGLTEGKHCSVCNEILVKQETVPALGHTEVIDEAVAPTCGATGLTEGKHCSVCNEVLIAQTIVDALGHSFDNFKCSTCGVKQTSTGLKYKYNTTQTAYIVYDIGTCTDTTIIIPDTFNELPVESVGRFAFSNCSNVIQVIIPDSIVIIDEYAFNKCTALQEITIPDNVEIIGDSAFYGCSSLETVKVGDNVKTIGSMAFYGCTNLNTVTLGNSVTTIKNSAFNGCTKLSNINIPNSVLDIQFNAFYGCQSLTSIELGSSVATLGNGVFTGCTNLESITIPSSLQSIGASAFPAVSYALKNVYITDLSAWCKINFSNSGSNPFQVGGETNLFLNGQKVTSLIIPDDITQINAYAFANCYSITNVYIPTNIKTIGTEAFNNCANLKYAIISESVESIDISAFGFNLESIYYFGSESSWEEINIASNNGGITCADIYWYSQQQPNEYNKYWRFVDGTPKIW